MKSGHHDPDHDRENILEKHPPLGGDAAPPSPFVWQHGLRLLLLDDESVGWVLAELEFDPETCRYSEIRRAVYEWEREAIGALLSRALASGDRAVREAAGTLNSWLLEHYGHTIHETRNRPNFRFAHDPFN